MNIINVTPVSVPGCVRLGLGWADWAIAAKQQRVAADQEGRGGSLPGQLSISSSSWMERIFCILSKKLNLNFGGQLVNPK